MHLRACRLLLLALALAGGCTLADGVVGTPLEPLASAGQRRLERVDATASNGRPVDAWMGSVVTEPMRVRVVDANGLPVSGAHVHFAVANDGGRLGPRGSDTATTVISDGRGIATAVGWTLPPRDTTTTRHLLSARLDNGDDISFVARAWRDVTRFGGLAPAVLDVMPIDRHQLNAILPLGTLGRDGALPSPDALLVPSAAAHSVRAMADGIVTEIDEENGAVTMRVRDEVRVRLGGVRLRADLWVGRVLHAGDSLGVLDATHAGAALAVRVIDGAMQRTRWVHAERYGARRNTAFFARYLPDSLRSLAYALVRRAAPDLDGRIDYDRDGRLVGTWFDPASPAVSSATTVQLAPFAALRASEFDPSTALAPVALTFAYDAEHPGQVRIAAGSALAAILGVPAVSAIAWEDPDPAEVGLPRGVVRYHLFAGDDVRIGQPERVLLVQLLDAGTLRVETVPARGADSAGFSSRAVTLVR